MDDSLGNPDAMPMAAAADARQRVLFVDDEPNILASLRRLLRGQACDVLTAESGAAALQLMRESRVDVVVSDMRMPVMDGVQLLEQIHENWPETVRILLTGHAEMSSTVGAINRGRIFRYVAKPWDEAELVETIRQGLEHVALVRDKARLEELTLSQNLELRSLNENLERRVLERTDELSQANRKLRQGFVTSIKVFSNLLELRGGRLLGHGRRVANASRLVARALALDEQAVQDIFVAGLLHDIGHIGLSDALLSKPVARLDADELARYRHHALLGEQSLMALEDLQPVATLIHAHHERFDGRGYPDGKHGTQIPLGARILAVADAFDELQDGHLGGATPSAEEARVLLRNGRGTQFDPEIVDTFLRVTQSEQRTGPPPLLVGTLDLVPDMVLASDLISPQGVLLLTSGHRLTESLIRRIRSFEQRSGESLQVQIRRGLGAGRVPGPLAGGK